jgi:hypothetical protein
LRRRFWQAWNNGKLNEGPGEHEHTEVVRDEPDLAIVVTYKYRVERRLFHGMVKLVKARGILNVSKGTFNTSGFETEMISMADVEQKWQHIDEGNLPYAVMIVTATDVFPLPGVPGTT